MGQTARYPVEMVIEAVPCLLSWLEMQRRITRTPGIQVAIRAGDQLVCSEALGSASLETDESLRTNHLFRIASHSKTFTATAVMQLREYGALGLDDRVSGWIPELSQCAVGAVTIRELLGHQGGLIRDGDDSDYWQLMHPFLDRDQVITVCREDGTVYDTNEHFKYTNIGYSLLGLIIEAASGQPYNDYVRTHIVERLGLTNTGPEFDAGRADEYAAGHTSLLDGEDTREVIGHVDTRAMSSATGFYSTAEDLTRYGAAHFRGAEDLITDASKRLIQRQESVVRNYGRDAGEYGLGMDRSVIGSRTWVGHGGGYPGHITRTLVEPQEHVVVSVLTNCLGGPAGQLAEGVVKLLDLAANPPDETTTPASEDLHRFTGRFAGLWGIQDIRVLGGRLVGFSPAMPDPTQGVDELDVAGPDTLQMVPTAGFGAVGQQVIYHRDAEGMPEWIRYGGRTSWPIAEFRRRRSALLADSRSGPPA